jgi:hypothetical protein
MGENSFFKKPTVAPSSYNYATYGKGCRSCTLRSRVGTYVKHKGRKYTWWEMTSPSYPGDYGDDLMEHGVKLIFPAADDELWNPCEE